MLTEKTLDCPGYSEVKEFLSPDGSFHCIIATHSTLRGPAAGGCRLWSYGSRGAALNDALRLAKGMSYKNAMADIRLGGGKAVILKNNAAVPNREMLFRFLGQAVNAMGGRYVTAEDVGTTLADMKIVALETSYVSGIASGDPSPWTARGVFLAITEAVRLRFGKTSVSGLTVAVQGLGAVGGALCDLLHKAGAKLVVSDLDNAAISKVRENYEAIVAPVSEIHQIKCDVLAPCALGATLNSKSIPEIRAKIICGAANNQLAESSDGQRLLDRSITYVPDYVANAGGIINAGAEYLGESPLSVEEKLHGIINRVAKIYNVSIEYGLPANLVADRVAEQRL